MNPIPEPWPLPDWAARRPARHLLDAGCPAAKVAAKLQAMQAKYADALARYAALVDGGREAAEAADRKDAAAALVAGKADPGPQAVATWSEQVAEAARAASVAAEAVVQLWGQVAAATQSSEFDRWLAEVDDQLAKAAADASKAATALDDALKPLDRLLALRRWSVTRQGDSELDRDLLTVELLPPSQTEPHGVTMRARNVVDTLRAEVARLVAPAEAPA